MRHHPQTKKDVLMPSYDQLSWGLDSDIVAPHRRFLAAMEGRLPHMPFETKEHDCVILASLVGKLEAPEKRLRDILHKMTAEAPTYLVQELGAKR
jgi:hypothetical protein